MRFVIFYILFHTLTVALCQTGKRGISYGHHSPQDLEVLSPEVSWWYNWSETPENAVAEVFADYGFDFVPMTWNGSFNETKLRNFLSAHPETKYLLAFNEPNFKEQANMTPTAVAAIWPRLEAIAEEYDLEIVGPAVNYCGNCVTENGTTYYDPFEYLDDFFAACPDCRVDHIAVHSYMNTVGALSWFIGEFRRYGKPIWLTEFAGWESNGNINNLNDQISFMIGAVDFLESDPDVFRYAWFIGRGSGIAAYPYVDLLGANGELTALGEVYKQMPVHDEDQVVDLPGVIEAEAYTSMSGILLEKTSDQTGFANVGYIEAGDWLEYRINVPESRTYPVHFRVASTKSASLNVLIDGEEVLTQPFTNTGGWQSWSTVENTVQLTAGVHTLRLHALTNGFNINWIHFGDLEAPLSSAKSLFLEIYPNPGVGRVWLNHVGSSATVEIMDLSGKIWLHGPALPELDLTALPAGAYLVKVQAGSGALIGVKRLIIR